MRAFASQKGPGKGLPASGFAPERRGALTASKLERLEGVRSLTRNLASTVAGTTVAATKTAAAYTSDKAAKIYSYASDALKGD